MKVLTSWKPQEWLYKVVEWLVENAEKILIRVTPLLSPLPSAFAIIHALTLANWSYPVLMGCIIEAMGMGSGAMIGYIATHNKKNPASQINKWLGWGLFSAYLAIAVSIIFGMESLPILMGKGVWGEKIKSLVPLLFPGLTLIGAVIVALRQHMDRMDKAQDHEQEGKEKKDLTLFDLDIEMKRKRFEQELAIAREEHEQRLELARLRVESKLSGVRSVSTGQGGQVDSQVDAQWTPPVWTDSMLDIYRTEPRLSNREMGRRLGKSPTTIGEVLSKLEVTGHVHRNGNGVEVIR